MPSNRGVRNIITLNMLTIYKHSKTQEVQISLSSSWIPSYVRVAFREKHGTHPKATSSQIRHHLSSTINMIFFLIALYHKIISYKIQFIQSITISRSCSCRASASSLLSMHDAAATSKGVDPRIPKKQHIN